MSGNRKRLRSLYAFTWERSRDFSEQRSKDYGERKKKKKKSTDGAKFIFKIIATMRGERDVIKVEPDLPEPATEPTAFLARAPDGLLVERRLLSGCIKIGDSDKTILRR
jgi:hypothetical protein